MAAVSASEGGYMFVTMVYLVLMLYAIEIRRQWLRRIASSVLGTCIARNMIRLAFDAYFSTREEYIPYGLQTPIQ